MKRSWSTLTAVLLLLCLISTASASTFGQTYSELRMCVRNNAGTHDVMDYTSLSGADCEVVVFETSTGTTTLGVFTLTGVDNSVISYKLFFDNTYSISRSAAMDIVNQWNSAKRYPRMYLDDDEKSFMADGYLFTTTDCPTSMVDQFVDYMIFGTERLLTMLEEQNALP